MNYEKQMIEHIKARNFAAAQKVHEAWANADFIECLKGLFVIESKVGKQLYGQYDDYCDENM